MPDFLLELGTEELPAAYQDRAVPALVARVEEDLAEVGLPAAEVRGAGTARRLTVWAGGLPARQPDTVEERMGPRKEAAFEEGQPTTPAVRFAESMGLRPEDLEVREVKKGKKTAEYLFGVRQVEGRPAGAVLAERIPAWIEAIPFPRSMRWVPGSRHRFARPLRRIAALLDREVVEVEWNGVRSGRDVQGHRFLAPEPVALEDASFARYLQVLRERRVVADPEERRRLVAEGLLEVLGAEQLERRAGLVGEVANLVEWPVVDVGSFDRRFLELPRLVVEEAMIDHQRYFPVEAGGELQPRFAYVANRPFDEGIRHGNERVLAARLQDALFFFELDRKRSLHDRVADLGEIVFMQELGSQRDKIARVEALALAVADGAGWLPREEPGAGVNERPTEALGPADQLSLHINMAATLARADLTTEVVQEFPSLQGEMGAIYARLEELPDPVAEAIREVYLPRGEGDAVPAGAVGTVLAVADRLDTIVSAYATGRGPTGSKDPFMVRRFTVGALRILRERQLDVGYRALLEKAVSLLPDEVVRDEEVVDEAAAYFRDRLRVQAREEGFHHDLVEAALEAGRDPTNVVDFWTRLEALRSLSRDERFPRLCELLERSRNITAKSGADVDPDDVDPERLEHTAEQALHQALRGCREEVARAIAERRYVDAGREYVESLADVVHTFFEPSPQGVFVMADDPRLRRNRLALLKQVHGLLAGGFADLAKVDAESIAAATSA